MLIGYLVLDGKSKKLAELFDQYSIEIDEDFGDRLALLSFGDPFGSGPVQKSLLSDGYRKEQQQSSARYVETRVKTKQDAHHRRIETEELRDYYGLSRGDPPCIVFRSGARRTKVGLLRVPQQWYSCDASFHAFTDCLRACVRQNDFGGVATANLDDDELSARLEPMLDRLTAEIDVATRNAANGKPVSNSTGPANTFKFDGENWLFSWNGTRLPNFRPLIGFEFIHYLLRHPRKEFPLSELRARTTGKRDDVADDDSSLALEARTRDTLQLNTRMESPIERGDRRTYVAVQNELDRLLERKDLIEDTGGDPGEVLIEIDKLQQYRNANYGIQGKPRMDARQHHSAQVGTNRALSRALERIGSHSVELHAHLQNSIHRSGAVYCYRPGKRIDWDL